MINLKHKLILITTALLLSTQLTYAKKDKGNKESKGHFAKMFTQLDLTKEQKEKVKEHRKSNKGKNKELREQIKSLREQIKTEFLSSGNDNSKLKTLHSQLLEKKQKMADTRFEKMSFFKSILTDKQRKKFIELRENGRNNRGHSKD